MRIVDESAMNKVSKNSKNSTFETATPSPSSIIELDTSDSILFQFQINLIRRMCKISTSAVADIDFGKL